MRIVVGHANPDFDAYAATVAGVRRFPGARGVYLGSQNRNVREFHTLHQDFLDFIDLRDLDLGKIESLVMVDTRDPGRIGELGKVALRDGVEVIVYDHHPPTSDDIVGADDRSREVGATTSILVHELMEKAVSLTPLEATAMLLGIHEDTGSLTYPNTTAFDAEAVTQLLRAGADMEVLAQFMTRALSLEQRALLDQLLKHLELWDVNGHEVAVALVRIDEYVDSASVVTHYLCEDMGYRIVLAAILMGDRLHVVGRSRVPEVDIGRVLAHVGGGGHSQAASAAMHPEDADGLFERLRTALEEEVPPPMTAADIGTSPVRTVEPETTMRDAGELMQRWGHGGLPVMREGQLVGLITRKDVDKAHRHGLEHAPVKGFMGRDIITVPADADVESLERLLTRESIGRVPVMKGGVPVAIVTRKDVLRAKHGAGYVDRRARGARRRSAVDFLRAVGSVLPDEHRRAMEALGELAEEEGVTAHVVGGFVRDMLLGRRNLDVDVVVEGDAVDFAERAASRFGGRVVVHRRFGTAVLVLSPSLHVDLASARTEYYSRPGALPTVEASSLRQDLLRRDFSINAMAACINPGCFGDIADPFGGLRDLEQGRIRVLHSLSFVEDPTRVYRAARFEQRYGFTIEPMTEELARKCVEMGMLDEVSGSRTRAELFEIMKEDDPASSLRRLADLGALGFVTANPSVADVVVSEVSAVAASYAALSPVSEAPLSRAHALILPLAARAERHEADRWARRLRLSREHIAAAATLAEKRESWVHLLDESREVPNSRLYAVLRSVAPEVIVYLHAVTGELGKKRIRFYLSELVHVQPAVSGADLVELGLEPGPAFSDILEQARAARLDGIAVGREAEMALLARLAAQRQDESSI